MGRPEAPVDFTVPTLGYLAYHLRLMRHSAGLTYSELAERVGYSAAHLKRAASGGMLPTLEVSLAYAYGCLGNHDDPTPVWTVLELHRDASKAMEEAAREKQRSTVVPKPQYARDPADLSGAMRDAWSRAGKPSARIVESRTLGQLPRSTANVITKGRTVPRDFRQYVAFLQACGISDRALQPWFRAWFKVVDRPDTHEAVRWLRFLPDIGTKKAYLDAYADGGPVPEILQNELTHVDIRSRASSHDVSTAKQMYERLFTWLSSTPNEQPVLALHTRNVYGHLVGQRRFLQVKAPMRAGKTAAALAVARTLASHYDHPGVSLVLPTPGPAGRAVRDQPAGGISDREAAAFLHVIETTGRESWIPSLLDRLAGKRRPGEVTSTDSKSADGQHARPSARAHGRPALASPSAAVT
ncbi:helix-turn-helix domain-containing protein [Streptomyces sp. B21-106]|uniref:helix-turn-helix domain-containing protein n=1 Tax=Streptomyces sp. B21-106 TaxID=3039418 RepID=UPI002FF292FA